MSLNWKPQPDDNLPVFRQIYLHYERRILQGELQPGDKLPTERELAARLSVNRSTVTAAYEELRAAGLATSVQGSGTRVSELMWNEAAVQTPRWERYAHGQAFNPSLAMQRSVIGRAAAPGVVPLIWGELAPDLMPLELLGHLARERLDFGAPYSYNNDARGELGLRESLSRHLLEERGIHASPSHLIVTSGVKHSLYLIARALLAPGDAVAVEGPSYLYALGVFAETGIRMVKLPVDGRGLVPEALPELYRRHRVRMVFTNPSYQNPTGTSLGLERRRELLAVCEQLRIPVVEDDPYGLLGLGASGREPALPALKAMSGGDALVLYAGTLSKTATPGMRIGWLAAPAPIVARLAAAKAGAGYSASHAGERLAQALLDSPGYAEHLVRVREALRRRRRLMLEAVARHGALFEAPYASSSPPGGFYVWLRLRRPRPDRELLDAAFREGVAVYPGSVYGAEPGYVRIAYASVAEDAIDEGIRRLGRACV